MSSLLSRARFLRGAVNAAGMPSDAGAEVAFAGRSNAGKSSAINVLTGMRGLARTSKTPGRTQEINFFELDDTRRLVDLPGYGYAQAPLAARARWERNTARYLQTRACLRGVVLMMDVRHPFTDTDQAFLAWCAEAGVAVRVLLTKADKLGRGRASAALAEARRRLGERGEVQLFSATARMGVEEAQAGILAWLEADAHDHRAKKIPG